VFLAGKFLFVPSDGGAEFAGPENVGPQKTMTGNCNTWKMMDHIAALEFATPGK